MQNAGIYHIAHRGVHSINSATVFPGALPLDPAGGAAPRPPYSRASRSYTFAPTYRTTSFVKTLHN